MEVVPQKEMQRISGIPEYRDAPSARHRLPKYFHPLAGEFRAVERDTANVAAGSGKTIHKTGAHRIGSRSHDDGNGRSLLFRRERRRRANGYDDVGTQVYEFRRQLIVGLGLVTRPVLTGSAPVVKTIGIVAVATLAASAAGRLLPEAITDT